MKAGTASRTAVLVCMGRAAAHGNTDEVRFSDPVAFSLLPDEARAQVERFRADAARSDLRARVRHAVFETRSKMMVARTVAIDEAIREAASPQLVILGAGLDGRAWRMPELRETVVFEVDHPDSQREKRSRCAALARLARDVRFVSVDFQHQSLAEALDAAGHDPTQPTTWVWEGVVMYLAPRDIEATLAVLERRSSPHSRLIVAYFSPALMLRLVGLVVRRMGEPLKSVFTADAMRALLQRYGFEVVRDQGLPAIGAALAPDVARASKKLRHLRIVIAGRAPVAASPSASAGQGP